MSRHNKGAQAKVVPSDVVVSVCATVDVEHKAVPMGVAAVTEQHPWVGSRSGARSYIYRRTEGIILKTDTPSILK
jgi:hypothetical protein